MARPKKRSAAPKRAVTIDLNADIAEEDVNDAVSVIRRDYYADVEGLGDSLIEAIKDGEIADREQFQDRLHEDVDGSQRVIYTWQAQLGILASENSDAYFEELGETLECDGSVPYEKLMFYAMQRDVVEYMTREGFDPDDESIFDDEGDEDEED